MNIKVKIRNDGNSLKEDAAEADSRITSGVMERSQVK